MSLVIIIMTREVIPSASAAQEKTVILSVLFLFVFFHLYSAHFKMSEAESVLAILKEVREGLQNLSCRVESLEGKSQNLTADESSGDHGGHTYAFSPSQGAYSAQFAPTSSVEADYLRVKGSVQSVRLPSDLTLQEAR